MAGWNREFVMFALIAAGCSGSGSTTSTAGTGSGGGASTTSATTTSSATTGTASGTTTSAATTTGSSSSTATGASTSTGGAQGPTVQILHPGMDPRPAGTAIYFHGTASDPTDGMLSGNALVWSDSLEGQFGTGDPVMWAPTMVGMHTVTLTATDSLQLKGKATVTFMVTAAGG